jgi:AraC-like DNA-binding protein
MDFTSLFFDALTAPPVLQPNVDPSVFLGTPYALLEETDGKLLTILSGGTIEVKDVYAFSLKPLDCRMILYTRQGSGTLRLPRKTYQLTQGTLLYLNCSTPDFWELSISSDIWQYTVFFMQGERLAFYESLVPFSHALLVSPTSYSAILPSINNLLRRSNAAMLRNKIIDACLLANVLTALFIEGFQLETVEEQIPTYLQEIKYSLDTYWREPLSLEKLESRYRISKYRICREFSAAFGLPPLKYLNRRRIETAKNMLLSGDKRVHEIANEVGYENTNHFINLFKKETGLTPAAYRRMMSDRN